MTALTTRRCKALYKTECSRFEEIRTEAADLDPATLAAARLAIRSEMEQAATDKIRRILPDKISDTAIRSAVSEVDRDLRESEPAYRITDRQRHHSRER